VAGRRGQISAGLLVFRRGQSGPEFLLVHPGGPYWANRDEGAWSVPKGLIDPGEAPEAAALREFAEETGLKAGGVLTPLTSRRQRSGKLVLCWLSEADLDLGAFASNSFQMEWPPRSGRTISIPECDRAAYFPVDAALGKILPGQRGFIEEALGVIARHG
jgi:predicted NUDIX family NTP pyrophosphohydrolase